jgi:hypothetical protein
LLEEDSRIPAPQALFKKHVDCPELLSDEGSDTPHASGIREVHRVGKGPRHTGLLADLSVPSEQQDLIPVRRKGPCCSEAYSGTTTTDDAAC